MTNAELNEAVAKTLGMKLITMLPGQPKAVAPRGSNGEPLPWRMAPDWATSVDDCLRDLLPVMHDKGFELAMEENQTRDEDETPLLRVWWVGAYRGMKPTAHHAEDHSLARAICLVFLEVMK